jgi:hypothetical protein
MNKKDRTLTARWLSENMGSYSSLSFLVKTAKNKTEKAELQNKLSQHIAFMKGDSGKKPKRTKSKRRKKTASTSNSDCFF